MSNEQKNKPFRSGFIAVVGRPNVGKSTLINSLMGQKLLIMSDKPQTTRNQLLCILTNDSSQMLFLDTPGIHKPKHKLGEYMVAQAEKTLRDVDLSLFVSCISCIAFIPNAVAEFPMPSILATMVIIIA